MHRQTRPSQCHTLAAPYAREANARRTTELLAAHPPRYPGPARGTQHGPAEPGASRTRTPRPEAATPTQRHKHGERLPPGSGSQPPPPRQCPVRSWALLPKLRREGRVQCRFVVALHHHPPAPRAAAASGHLTALSALPSPDRITAASGHLTAHRLTAGGPRACAQLGPRAAVSLATAGAARWRRHRAAAGDSEREARGRPVEEEPSRCPPLLAAKLLRIFLESPLCVLLALKHEFVAQRL